MPYTLYVILVCPVLCTLYSCRSFVTNSSPLSTLYCVLCTLYSVLLTSVAHSRQGQSSILDTLYTLYFVLCNSYFFCRSFATRPRSYTLYTLNYVLCTSYFCRSFATRPRSYTSHSLFDTLYYLNQVLYTLCT